MGTRLTQKQNQFALCIFQGMTQREAWKEAGYSTNYPIAHIDRDASLLANSPKIIQRLQELRQKTESAAVMNVQERKERLTEIARAKLTDFVELGQDGSWVNIGKEMRQGGAIQEIHSRTQYDENGANPTVYTSVKLHDPMKAIDLMNRMEKLYTDGVLIDNRKIAIYDAKGKLTSIITSLASRIEEEESSRLLNG